MPQPSADPARALVPLILATGIAAAIFSLWPGIDLWVARQFYGGAGGFAAEQNALGQWLRYRVWDLSVVFCVLAVILWAAAMAGWRLRGIGARIWGFVALLFLLGPVLLINVILKDHWGRARPADVTDFGGTRIFTPFWEPTDQCRTNCSFASGEVSGATAIAVAFLVLGPALTRGWPRWARRIYAAFALTLPVFTIAQRVVSGRHFLSDATFAVLLTLIVAAVLARVLRIGSDA